jgi:hypothetical protein
VLHDTRRTIHVTFPLLKEMFEDLDPQELPIDRITVNIIPWKID